MLKEVKPKVTTHSPHSHHAQQTSKAMLQNTFVTTKYSTPSQVVTLAMPFPKLSLEPL
jgi:hypothetical protein